MPDEPSILNQLNSIIEYLNFHGQLFFKIPANLESDDKNETTDIRKTENP